MKSREDYCTIYYRKNGEDKTWSISAHPEKDNEESLAAHLKRWMPDAEFLGHAFGEGAAMIPATNRPKVH